MRDAALNLGRAMRTSLCAYADSEGPDQPAHADLGLRCPQTELLDTIECINGEQRLGSDFAHAWDASEYEHFAHA